MIAKLPLIVAMCSIPLIVLIILPQNNIDCSGDATCLKGKITDVVNGYTIETEDSVITLSLISTNELDITDGMDVKKFVESTCPVGSDVLVDEDDGQINGSYGGIVGKVFCQGIILNEKILENQSEQLDSIQCFSSEFADEDWAKKHGC